ncbi:MAG: YqhA family protein, partial [Cyanobacteria bacterium J06576_12]
EELKSKLVKVIVVALIVNLFKKTLSLDISDVTDVIYVALSILLIAASNYLLHLQAESTQNPND